QASGHLNLARRTSGGELRIGLDTFYKTQGVPGTSSAELRGAHLSSFRQTAELQIDRRQLLGPRGSGRGRAWLAVERRRFDDPVASDFGAAIDAIDVSLAGGITTRGTLAIGDHQIAALAPELAIERFSSDNRAVPSAGLSATRLAGALTLADDIALAG